MRRHDGSDDVLPLAFTFADFALLDPAYAAHFRAVPAAVPESELVPVAEHCAAPPEDDDHRVPFIWAVDGDHRLLRLAISRPLALACRDRLDFWRTLQELAGVRSEHVDRAVAQARADAEQRARQEREQLEAAHAAELEHLRRDAAEEVATRMTAALLEIDVAEPNTRTPMISPGSTHPETTAGKSFVFRVTFLDLLQGEALARFAAGEFHPEVGDPRHNEADARALKSP